MDYLINRGIVINGMTWRIFGATSSKTNLKWRNNTQCCSLRFLISRSLIVTSWLKSCSRPCMYVAHQEALSLCASGRTIGSVLESGDGVTDVVSVHKDYSLPESIMPDLTVDLVSTLNMESEFARETKDYLCYASHNIENELVAFKICVGWLNADY